MSFSTNTVIWNVLGIDKSSSCLYKFLCKAGYSLYTGDVVKEFERLVKAYLDRVMLSEEDFKGFIQVAVYNSKNLSKLVKRNSVDVLTAVNTISELYDPNNQIGRLTARFVKLYHTQTKAALVEMIILLDIIDCLRYKYTKEYNLFMEYTKTLYSELDIDFFIQFPTVFRDETI